MRAVRVHQPGGPEALVVDDVAMPEPTANTVRVKVEAIGVNFIDIYHRSGLYPMETPFVPGREAAGVVDAVGEGVTDVQVGDRVAFAMVVDTYAEYVLAPAAQVVPVPDAVSLETAAAVMLQGMTAHYLAYATYPLQAGDKALIHAAAGGVGLLLVQIAKRCGAYVIGTVSTDEKAALAKQAGADEIILYTQTDFESETLRLTNHEGVHVVYDSVGQTTFDKSLNCLRPRGYLVLFGQSSGPVEPFNIQRLMSGGSLYLTRPSLQHYLLTRDERLQRAGDLFAWIAAGELDVRIDRTFALDEAAAAHEYLAGRKAKGKILLIP